MSPGKNHEEPLFKRLARSRALNSRNASREREASMSPTRYEQQHQQQQQGLINQHHLQPGVNHGGQYIQYVPCAFIVPNYSSNVSSSLPTLVNQHQFSAPVFPQRKLSKLSNLVWTTSVSQPDLTATITSSPTVSPATSLPTSRASSPAPPSISARCSPHGVPSPYLSPLDSSQHNLFSSLSPASSSLSDMSGSVMSSSMCAAPVSSLVSSRHDTVYLHSALNNLAMNQNHSFSSSQHNIANTVPVPGSPAANTYYSPLNNVSTAMIDSNPHSGSCSPRQVTFSRPEVNKKPCAVIAPVNVQSQEIKNSVSASSSLKVDEFGLSSSAPTSNNSWRLLPTNTSAHSSDTTALKLRERSLNNNNGSCPENINFNSVDQSKRSIGTSCSDLPNNAVPFVVETCQICRLFHPKVTAEPGEHVNNPCFVYSPCLHGNQVMVKSGGSSSSNNSLLPNNTVKQIKKVEPNKRSVLEKFHLYTEIISLLRNVRLCL